MRRYMEDLCIALPAADPAAQAEELALLQEGSIVTAQVSQEGGRAARVAKTVAASLIGQAMVCTGGGDIGA